jgi:hypothetical protein
MKKLPYMRAELDDGASVTPVLDLFEVVAALTPSEDHASQVRL